MKKKALIIGINDYPNAPLQGCVHDANKMYRLLSFNGDGSRNWYCDLITTADRNQVTTEKMNTAIENLLSQKAEAALLYFSGHGVSTDSGGFLVSQDYSDWQMGVAFDDILNLVNQSKIDEITIIIDCCYSGDLGNVVDPGLPDVKMVHLRKGVSLLTSCSPKQLAEEDFAGGLFTAIIANALEGEAADILGKVTVEGIYYQADSLLNAWDQRPMYKSHLSRMWPLRIATPRIALKTLKLITTYFPTIGYEFHLEPEYEDDKRFAPEGRQTRDPQKEAVMLDLQAFRDLNLIEPMVPHRHLYWACIQSGKCRLTQMGRFYWKMVDRGKI